MKRTFFKNIWGKYARSCRLIVFLAFKCILLAVNLGTVKAQLYESNCYFPQFGKPGEIDTVYGDHTGQQLGSDVFNPGPLDKYPQGKIFIQGLPQNLPFLSAIDPKPTFDLHNFQIEKKNAFSKIGLRGGFAHIHDSKHWDFYCADASNNDNPRIFWADDDGNYDSTKVTYLKLPSRVGRAAFFNGGFNDDVPVTAHFTSDTVCDMILLGQYGTLTFPDTIENYFVFFNGGSAIFQIDSLYPDSLYSIIIPDHGIGEIVVGNWRQKGKDDLIGIDGIGNLYYYKNDPPFSLQKLLYAMTYDTLLSRWENPGVNSPLTFKATSAFPKGINDSSQDLRCDFSLQNNKFVDHYYKGGKDFGSHRLYINKPDFLFHTPRWYTTGLFGFAQNVFDDNVGDLTGKGFPVQRITYALGNSSYEFYYLLGGALNDHADMSYRPEPGGTGVVANLDANGDGKKDLIEGSSYFTTQSDQDQGKYNVGLLGLIYGSAQIPINLSDVKNPIIKTSDFEVYPNPASSFFSFNSPEAQELQINLFDLLGRKVFHTNRNFVQEHSKLTIQLPALPSGEYVLSISIREKVYHSQLHIIH